LAVNALEGCSVRDNRFYLGQSQRALRQDRAGGANGKRNLVAGGAGDTTGCVLTETYGTYWVLTLALGVSAIRATCELGAQCSGEAKVSIERNGPNGTIAGDRPDSSESKLVVALALRGTCWATGSFYLKGGEGPGSRHLTQDLKSVGLIGGNDK
jgi:hypothetical protein